MLPPAALCSDIGHGQCLWHRAIFECSSWHHAIFVCSAVGKNKRRANRELFSLTNTLMHTSVNGPYDCTDITLCILQYYLARIYSYINCLQSCYLFPVYRQGHCHCRYVLVEDGLLELVCVRAYAYTYICVYFICSLCMHVYSAGLS